jgi:putative tryptophan/tyrosine transport system substrate-binding protein
MNRRSLIFSMLAGALTAWPFGVIAKSLPTPKRIAVLMASKEGDTEGAERMAALRSGFETPAGVNGSRVQLDVWWYAGVSERAEEMAREIVAQAPDLIIANGTLGLAALKPLTSTIPIVFVVVTDPVGAGFVESFARPGGNITGFSTFEPEIAGKWVQTLKEAAPAIRRVGFLTDPDAKGFLNLTKAAEAAAKATGLAFEWVHAGIRTEIEQTFGDFAAKRRDAGVVVFPAAVNSVNRDLIVAISARHRLPVIYPFAFQARSGGLLAYGFDAVDQFRRSIDYARKILAGGKPGELPVQAPVKFSLVLNLKAAKAIGLTFPTALLLGATEVIE